jgi:peptidoglycan/LPS O-acetylase OafA/YrhL
MKNYATILPNITFFRFVAALWIVVYHFGLKVTTIHDNHLLNSIFKNGFQAVSFFYVLSGFIMAFIYYTANLENKFNVWKYWKARFARIYPAYFFAFVLSLFVYFYWGNKLDFIQAISELFCLHTWRIDGMTSYYNYPDWSISVEFFFYLCFPLIIKSGVKWNITVLTLIAASLWIITQLYYNSIPVHDQKTLEYFPLLHLSSFILGVYGGIIYFKFNKQILSVSKWKVAVLTFTIFCILFLFQFFTNTKENVGFYSPLFLLLIILLVTDKYYLARFFSTRIADFLGDISYSLYIFQYPVYIFSKMISDKINFNVDSVSFFMAYLVALVTISVLTYTFIEKPFRKFILETKRI